MVFVMDSESAGRKNTQKVTDFMKTVANSVDLSSETIQMGMLQPDDCEPSVHSFKLDGDRDHLVSSLDGHDADKLPRLIRELRRHEFNAKNGARKDAKKIAIILIDGELAEPLKALREARRANLRGIEVFIIVVSKDPPQPEINSMCAYPPENHLFQVPDYDKLQDLQDSLIDMLCDEL
ncbi:uncharacterized protein LOC131944812 [Physella acuta]|uniref:uncharacterized protein LOC131944812 n=1 Tax=Physella acuta TaxID=109671 RepID=UPI0027DD4E44|nr:uncharacterized protein LOC131944812 [Physella acuta]